MVSGVSIFTLGLENIIIVIIKTFFFLKALAVLTVFFEVLNFLFSVCFDQQEFVGAEGC